MNDETQTECPNHLDLIRQLEDKIDEIADLKRLIENGREKVFCKNCKYYKFESLAVQVFQCHASKVMDRNAISSSKHILNCFEQNIDNHCFLYKKKLSFFEKFCRYEL
jgi:ribosome biogenesis GTPase A